jgi:hypothetical protein
MTKIVTVLVKGKEHSHPYYTEKGIVYIGDKKTQIGASEEETAKMLLIEIIREI